MLSHTQQPATKRAVALQVGHVLLGELRLPDRRQDADHQQACLQIGGNTGTLLPGRAEAGLEPAQRRTPQVLRMIIQFDIKARQLGHHHRIIEGLEKLFIDGRRPRRAINQPGLEFETAHAVTR